MSRSLFSEIAFLLCVSFLAGSGMAFAAQVPWWSPRALVQPQLEAIDAHLRSGDWEGGRSASLQMIETARKGLMAYPLAGAVARLALAEAGLGRKEDAIWHWHVALNLDRAVLSPQDLEVFGPPGELLARSPLRRLNETPADLTVIGLAEAQGGAAPEGKPELPTLSAEVEALSVPKTLRLQVIVGIDGRLSQPVISEGGAPGVVWEVLEGIRHRRFEPANSEGRPVAVFREMVLRPVAEKSLAALMLFSGEQADLEVLVRTGKWGEARKRAGKLWMKELKQTPVNWKNLAAILTLRALADAGTGLEDAAICRWQASQFLDPDLYDADLSSYGKAGELLERNRWGSILAGTQPGVIQEPEVVHRARITAPTSVPDRLMSGTIVLGGIVNEQGSVRQPAILTLLDGTWTHFGGEITSGAPVAKAFSFQGSARALAVSALDAFCEWRFRPATIEGKPIAFQGLVYVPFYARLGNPGMPGPRPRRDGAQ